MGMVGTGQGETDTSASIRELQVAASRVGTAAFYHRGLWLSAPGDDAKLHYAEYRELPDLGGEIMTDYGFAWHIHHQILLEPLLEPIESRIAYIKANKPANEVPTRLKLLRPVKGPLPPGLVKAGEAYAKA